MSTFVCPGCSDRVGVISPDAEVDHPCPARKRRRTTFVRVEAAA